MPHWCVTIIVICLAGCAAPTYRQTRADALPVEEARAECRWEVEKATAGLADWYTYARLGRMCMERQGWTR
jgi:hypothetical protein